MGRLLEWWGRLTGRSAGTATPQPQAERPGRAARSPRPATAAPGLELADEAPAGHSSRVGESGFDPYSSDAGYSKPHSWERVDHD